jgi:hypothetical protein
VCFDAIDFFRSDNPKSIILCFGNHKKSESKMDFILQLVAAELHSMCLGVGEKAKGKPKVYLDKNSSVYRVLNARKII